MQIISGSLSSVQGSPLKSSVSRLGDEQSDHKKTRTNCVKDARLSALIVEDDAVAREALKSMLKQQRDLEVIGTSSTGPEAVEAINRLKPDVVFLDIELPEMNGFDVLGAIENGRRPAVIFVTANEMGAARAFDVDAIDYLVKPCTHDRLESALDRARERMRQGQVEELHQKIESLLADLTEESNGTARITIKSNGRIVFLRLADIDWAEAADNYVNLHAGTESHLFRETMNALEQRLPAKRFVRISRSAMEYRTDQGVATNVSRRVRGGAAERDEADANARLPGKAEGTFVDVIGG
jgi:two-component system LytT family response regulator